jgi:anti-sigma-K factor RskA
MLQAGEYVLGTLAYDDVLEMNAQLEEDVELQEMLIDWQERFQPLADAITPVTPPLSVWRRIVNEISISANHPSGVSDDRARPRRRRHKNDRSRTWQWIGSAALAASLLLAVLLWQAMKPPGSPEFRVVSIVRAQDDVALWIINASLEQNTIQITAISPPDLSADQDHELWVVKPDDQGVRSLGVLPRNANDTLVRHVGSIPDNGIAFAVSLEPRGGSAGPVPSGPVLFQSPFDRIPQP